MNGSSLAIVTSNDSLVPTVHELLYRSGCTSTKTAKASDFRRSGGFPSFKKKKMNAGQKLRVGQAVYLYDGHCLTSIDGTQWEASVRPPEYSVDTFFFTRRLSSGFHERLQVDYSPDKNSLITVTCRRNTEQHRDDDWELIWVSQGTRM